MFIWDTKKAQSNYEKHGVSFEEAVTAFNDEFGLELDDIKHSTTEKRYARFAVSSEGRVLTVIFTVRRLSNDKEAIRIISARCASREERKNYSRFKNRLQ